MKRKEKPVQTNTHELSDKDYAEYKKREQEKRKRKYSPWFDKGRY